MSNTLIIKVLATKEIKTGAQGVMWVASDDYGQAFSNTLVADTFAECYPTEHDLIMEVLQDPAFGDVAIITGDTYELDACSGIYVEGLTEFHQNYMQ